MPFQDSVDMLLHASSKLSDFVNKLSVGIPLVHNLLSQLFRAGGALREGGRRLKLSIDYRSDWSMCSCIQTGCHTDVTKIGDQATFG